jgi:heat shock protein HslJ
MKKILFAMVAMVTFAACAEKAQTTLEDTEWKLIELKGESNTLFAAEPDSFFFTLSKEDGLNGVGACNRFFGSYVADEIPNALRLDPMGITNMACENMDLEDEFVKTLYEVDSYAIEGDILSLLDEGNVIAKLQATAKAE